MRATPAALLSKRTHAQVISGNRAWALKQQHAPPRTVCAYLLIWVVLLAVCVYASCAARASACAWLLQRCVACLCVHVDSSFGFDARFPLLGFLANLDTMLCSLVYYTITLCDARRARSLWVSVAASRVHRLSRDVCFSLFVSPLC